MDTLYPLIRDVNTYWFGSLDSGSSSYWINCSDSALTNQNCSYSRSWQDISIEGRGGIGIVAMIFRSADFVSYGLEFFMAPDSISSVVGMTQLLILIGSVNSENRGVLIDIILLLIVI
jgi:hypothetical protein